MKRLLIVAVVAGLAGCGSLRSPEPGMTTAQLEASMGQAADKRVHSDGETWYYYPRQPHGLQMVVARVGKEGRVLAVEQRLTDENVARLEKGKTRADDVRDLLGPPWKVWPYPRMQREIWTYQMPAITEWKVLFVQFSPDRVLREYYYIDDPEVPKLPAGTFRR